MSTEATPEVPRRTRLPRTSPSEQGVDARGVDAFLDVVEALPGVELHGLQVLRHGAVVAEGWWAPYGPERPHLLYSVSKSFTATALGFAVAEGLVDLDAPVLSYFPELDADVTDERSRRTLVRHVAAMASGHREETLQRALQDPSGDVVRGFLRLPPEAEPGTLFCYNQPCTYSLAAIVQRASGQGLVEYLRPRLLDPLGVGEVGWVRDGSGREIGFSGLHATTEDVAALGQLHLAGGLWAGERLLSGEWVEEATRSHADTSEHPNADWQLGYGFQFWRSRHGYRADGAYGQFALVLPEQDAVVAITSQSTDTQALLEAVWKHLLPALSDPRLPADAAQREQALRERLAAAQLEPVPDAGGDLPQGEFRPALGSEPASLSALRVEGEEVVLVDSGEELRLAVGRGRWAGTGPLAVSGSPSRLDVVFAETPHRLHLRLEERTGEFRGAWRTEPLHAPALSRLRSPLPGRG